MLMSRTKAISRNQARAEDEDASNTECVHFIGNLLFVVRVYDIAM